VSGQTELDAYAAEMADRARETGEERALNVTTDDDWNDRAWRAIVRLTELGIEFDADDLRAAVGRPPSQGAMGAIIHKARRAGMIEAVGFGRSRSATRHAGLQLRWRAA
jgi:hypothetical protein